MSSCVCYCGLNKWHLAAPNWLRTQERRNNWVNEICSCLFTHQCGFSVERDMIILGSVEAFFEDRNCTCLWIIILVTFMPWSLNISFIYHNFQGLYEQTKCFFRYVHFFLVLWECVNSILRKESTHDGVARMFDETIQIP